MSPRVKRRMEAPGDMFFDRQDHDAETLQKLKTVLELIAKECEYDMPLSYVRVLVELMLAFAEGGDARYSLSQSDLIERLGAGQSSISRAVAAMTDARDAKVAAPYEVADSRPWVMDRRYRVVRLNHRGLVLMRQILAVLEGAKLEKEKQGWPGGMAPTKPARKGVAAQPVLAFKDRAEQTAIQG